MAAERHQGRHRASQGRHRDSMSSTRWLPALLIIPLLSIVIGIDRALGEYEARTSAQQVQTGPSALDRDDEGDIVDLPPTVTPSASPSSDAPGTQAPTPAETEAPQRTTAPTVTRSRTTRTPPPSQQPTMTRSPRPQSTSTPPDDTTARRTTPPLSDTAQVLELVNAERSRVGCSPVAAHEALGEAARAHSSDMAAHDYFSHTGRNGSSVADRARAAGYASSFVGENIAAGQPTAQDVVDAWFASEGHRANILNCEYTHMGLGRASGGSYGTYWTQVFGG